MNSILIQIVFYQMLFLALYEVLLKRDTNYNLQRFYLLLLPIVALFLPFVVVPSLSEILMESYAISLPTVILGESGTASESVTTAKDSISSTSYAVMLILWFVGTILSGIWFLWKYRKLQKIRASASIVKKEGYNLAILPNTNAAFSFGNIIYLGEELDDETKKVILQHEKVHVKQKHSVDLILFQLLQIAFWWNPLIYLFQNRLHAVHEYIADAEVVQSITKKEYYQSLLSQVFKTNGISFTNTFYKESLIKKRIIMLQKIKSPKRSKLKYLLVLPLLAFMLVVVSCADEEILKPDAVIVTEGMPMPPAPPIPPSLPEGTLEDGDMELLEMHTLSDSEPVSFNEIDKEPTFPGCEEEDRRACMNSKMMVHIKDNFNTELGKKLGLEGMQKILLSFTIDKTGSITNIRIRGPHKELEEETERVMSLLPKLIPGEANGNKIGVAYTLPIRFEVN